MSKKIENWKANANVVWLVAAVVGMFTLNALRVALRPPTWSDEHTRGQSRAAADILLLHNTIEGLAPKLEQMPHRYALFMLSTALNNATIMEDALVERIGLLNEHRRNQRRLVHGVQLVDIPEIVAGVRAQLAQAVRYVETGCFGKGPAITSTDWFDDGLISRFNQVDRASFAVAPVPPDDDQNPDGSNVNRSAPVAPEPRFDERRVAGDDSVAASGESPSLAKPTLSLIQGGLA